VILLRTARLWIVPGLLGALGLGFAVRPRAGDVSAVENRPLAAPPRCNSVARWFDGSCTREIDLYVADHFPGRERFVTAAFWMKAHRGLPPEAEALRVVEVRSLDEGWLERLEDWAPLDAGTESGCNEGDGGCVPGPAGEPDPVSVDTATPADAPLPACAPDPLHVPCAPCVLAPGSPAAACSAAQVGADAVAAAGTVDALPSPCVPSPVSPVACRAAQAGGDATTVPDTVDAGLPAAGLTPTTPPLPRPNPEQLPAPAAPLAAGLPAVGLEPTPAHLPAPGPLQLPAPAAAHAAALPSAVPAVPAGGLGPPAAAEVLPAAATRPPGKPMKVELSNGILIAGSRAMQLFGGTEQSAQAYAQVINGYAERLAGKVKVHSVVVPSAVSFHLPADQAHRSRSERENLATLASALRPDVTNPDTFPALQACASDEPLYLRTDHHWNGLGAYRAYEAFCRAAGFSPVALGDFRHGQKPGFVGSYAAFTQDAALRAAPDVVDHYDPPVAYSATRYLDAQGVGAGQPARFVDPQLRGYLVFLGGDAPLLHARTEVRNGRRAVFVKNSFGNAFAPLLLSHFEELYVVDYRYYAGSLDALVQRSGATDLIFFNVTLLANAAPHRQRLAVLGKGSKAWVQPSARPDAGTPPGAGEAEAAAPTGPAAVRSELPADAGE